MNFEGLYKTNHKHLGLKRWRTESAYLLHGCCWYRNTSETLRELLETILGHLKHLNLSLTIQEALLYSLNCTCVRITKYTNPRYLWHFIIPQNIMMKNEQFVCKLNTHLTYALVQNGISLANLPSPCQLPISLRFRARRHRVP